MLLTGRPSLFSNLIAAYTPKSSPDLYDEVVRSLESVISLQGNGMLYVLRRLLF